MCNYNRGDFMRLHIYPEMCCDLCNEIIHNHFDCPECGQKNASTDAYGNIAEMPDEILKCQNCGAEFRLMDGAPYDATANWFKL